MFYSIRAKLIISFLIVGLLTGSVSLWMGGYLLYTVVIEEAKNRIRLDLNAASHNPFILGPKRGI